MQGPMALWERHRRKVEREAEARLTPYQRAERLLRDHLTPTQLKTWEMDHFIQVVCRQNGRIWRIYNYYSGNLYARRNDGQWARYCMVPRVAEYTYAHIPVADHVLACKLMIEHDDSMVLAKAFQQSTLGVDDFRQRTWWQRLWRMIRE